MPEINASLRAAADEAAEPLRANGGIAFQGMLPGADFVVDLASATKLLAAEPLYEEVVRPYLSGDDIAGDPRQRPSRFVVYFGTMTLEEAMRYPVALAAAELQARHARESSRSYGRNPRWWQFLWPRPVFVRAAADLPRFIAGTATGKRILFCWCDKRVVASNSTNVFALSDDFHFAVLTSSIHVNWARAQSSTMEDRIRYTPTSAFETFPWPQGDRQVASELAKKLYARRSAICDTEKIGLTTLYNQLDDGAWVDLRELHHELDEAIASAYGWPREVAHDADESNRRLLELNRSIATGATPYKPPISIRVG